MNPTTHGNGPAADADADDFNTLDPRISPWLRGVLADSTTDMPVAPPEAPEAARTTPASGDSTGGPARFSVATSAPIIDLTPAPTLTAGPGESVAPPPAPIRVVYGEEVPGYEIGDVLGRGGMGVVYFARQIELNRTVALKMVLGGGKARPQELARFLAEAALVASIRHPNVVTVYEYGEHNGKPFMALEFLPGGTLSDKTIDGKLPPLQAATIMLKIARGMAAAHAEQIVHRDLKPQNVLFDAAGEPKIVDFGLARRAAGTGLTATEAVMGTPSYMSPEQAGGRTKFAGPPADVWSMGVMLYELTTGVRPFGSGSFHEIMARVLRGEFQHPSAVSRMPRDLEQICLRCLEPLASDRYPGAAELADDLQRFLSGESVTARPAGPAERAAKWVRRRPSVAAAWGLGTLATLLTAFGGTAAFLWQEAEAAGAVAVTQREEATKARAQAEGAEAEALAARDKIAAEKRQTESALGREQVARSAEALARRAAEVAAGNERLALAKLTRVQYGRTIDLAHRAFLSNDVARAARLLADTPADRRGWEWSYVEGLLKPAGALIDPKAGPAVAARFAPDGQSVLTAHHDGTARLWDARTGAAGKVLSGHTGEVTDVAFVPDKTGGMTAVSASADGTARYWNLATGEGTVLESAAPEATAGGVKSKLLSVAVYVTAKGATSVVAGDDQGGVVSWSLPSGKLGGRGNPAVGPVQAVAFSPAGRLAAAGNGVLVGGGKGKVTLASPARVNAVAWRDATTLAAGCDDGVVRVWDVESGRQVAAFPADTVSVTGVAYLDPATLITCGRDRAVGVWDAATGRRKGALRGHADAVWAVTAAPGRAASASLDGTVRLWDLGKAGEWESRRPIDGPVTRLGTGTAGRLTVGGRNGQLAAVAVPIPGREDQMASRSAEFPEARRAGPGADAVLALADRAKQVFALPMDGLLSVWAIDDGDAKPARGAPIAGATAAAFAPAGDYRLAVGTKDGKLSLYTKPDGAPLWTTDALPKEVGAVAFSPDGQRVACGPATEGKGVAPVVILDAATGKEVARCEGGPAGVRSLAFSPDGKSLACGGADHSARVWDAESGRELAALRGHGQRVEAVAFSPDGKRLATASLDGLVKLWEVESGNELLALPAPDGEATAAAFSPDGKLLHVGGGKGEVRTYRAPSYAAK